MRYRVLNLLTALVACLQAITPLQAAAEPLTAEATVLITGANRGIGFEFARQYAERGWQVIATARSPGDANDLQALAAQYPGVAIELLDVTRPDQIAALSTKYAARPIDVLLLNAAKGPQQPTATAPLKRQDFDIAASYFATNAIGPMRVAQAFMDNVKASGRKQVIAISSDSGSFVAGSQLPILYHYKASKAALNMYFHNLSFEARKRGVTVIMLHPGMVATNAETARLPGAMPTEESVTRMLDVIDQLTPADNGRFMDYRGENMPW